jgi:hypothetical protein
MLDTTGRCEHCKGIVRNADGKRYTIPELTAIHDETCPGRYRRTTK